jgi:hypothetical protein
MPRWVYNKVSFRWVVIVTWGNVDEFSLRPLRDKCPLPSRRPALHLLCRQQMRIFSCVWHDGDSTPRCKCLAFSELNKPKWVLLVQQRRILVNVVSPAWSFSTIYLGLSIVALHFPPSIAKLSPRLLKSTKLRVYFGECGKAAASISGKHEDVSPLQ